MAQSPWTVSPDPAVVERQALLTRLNMVDDTNLSITDLRNLTADGNNTNSAVKVGGKTAREMVASLGIGIKGDPGINGINGINGIDGAQGIQGIPGNGGGGALALDTDGNPYFEIGVTGALPFYVDTDGNPYF